MIGIISITSCKDEDPCATWDGDIKAIVDASCAYAGCHSGAATAELLKGYFLVPKTLKIKLIEHLKLWKFKRKSLTHAWTIPLLHTCSEGKSLKIYSNSH